MESIEVQMLYEVDAIRLADVCLGTEFHRFFLLPSHYGTQIGFCQTYDAMRNFPYIVQMHIFLLDKYHPDGFQAVVEFSIRHFPMYGRMAVEKFLK